MQSTEKNIMWNVMGYMLPILITLVVIPFTIDIMGTENFGVLSLIWVIVGYSSFLDFGVGRALTHYISSNILSEDRHYIPSAVKKVLILLLLISLSFSTVIYFSIELIFNLWGDSDWLSSADIAISARIAVVTAFLVIISSAVRGVLEGYEEFKFINFVRLFSGISISVSPFVIYSFIPKLWVVILSFLIIRLVEVILYSTFVKIKISRINTRKEIDFSKLKKILSFGVWSNLTNIAGSPMAAAYLDKAVIASVLGASALTYYSVPFDVIARFLILPAMITGVLFPLLSKLKGQTEEADRLSIQALEIMAYVIAPFFLLAIVLAKPLMEIWLGDVSVFMFIFLQIFAVGKFAESLNFVLLSQIQALGRPDLTAKRHLLELPFYCFGIYFASQAFGLIGVAFVWTSWAILDLLILFYIRNRLTKTKLPPNIRSGKMPLIYSVFFAFSYISAWKFQTESFMLFFLAVILVIVFYIVGWFFLLNNENKKLLVTKLSLLLVRFKLMRI